ncbi:55 kDa erythrocyte membrane protein [Echinococcus multilocularis]|uniref:55 kDa erythrocyte membrane protein n=1 Tax=Echinococcus multilocularis TaxID=6211 RepID=A0A068YIR0_ECHMU|nr:55 kDa erythrocyte membrane protein [Echinococcus multilocularis]
MHSGINSNNHTDLEGAPHIHRCERCHAALTVPCCHNSHLVVNSSNSHQRPVERASHHRSNVRFVEVRKAKGEALGLTLRSSASGRCIIARIIHGGLTHKTGILHVRDEILEINGNPVTGHSIESVQQYLLASAGVVVLKIAPSLKGQKPAYQMYVRAMFDYDPREDLELPCAELGQSFKVGDILEIVDAADSTWWQARKYKAGSGPTPAGLIPSADLEESRVVRATNGIQGALMADSLNAGNHISHISSLRHLLAPRKVPRSSTSNSSTGGSGLNGLPGNLERSLSHWMPFRRRSRHRRHRSVSRRRTSSKRRRPTVGRSHSSETFSFAREDEEERGDGEEANEFTLRQNGHYVEEIDSVGSTIPSQTCSRCNSTLRTNTSTSTTTTTTTASAGMSRRPPRWSECAAFLFSEVAFTAYEEVTKVHEFHHRCLVILGAHGVGRRALRKALVRGRPDLFAHVIPHTTRKPEANERNGEHYYFVQEEEMAADIVSREFLEYGQRKNILFGIRLDSVRAVIATGRMPVLDVEPRALRILRSAEFAPLVVLLVPPPLSRLLSQDGQHDMLDGSLTQLVQESEVLEYVYRPYVDRVVVHRGVEESVDEVVELVNDSRHERWVPIGWTC